MCVTALGLCASSVINISNFFKKKQQENQSLYQLLLKDLVFRKIITNGCSAIYAFLMAVINFSVGLYDRQIFYISISAIYATIYIMKVYLLCCVNSDKPRHTLHTAFMMTLMMVASFGVFILYIHDQAIFEPKDLIIYWDALYFTIVVILAINGAFRAHKEKNLFLSNMAVVKIANAIFSLFTFTVTMVATFDNETSSNMDIMCYAVGFAMCVMLLIEVIWFYYFYFHIRKRYILENK